jgi:NADPH:quinone reductase-like Zn-dependent oxidoreductase
MGIMTMRAVRVDRYGSARELTVSQVPVPEPKAGEALVRVHAAGVNPADWKLRAGLIPFSPPFVLGLDLAGVVEAPAADGTGPAVGTVVYGVVRPPAAYAEFVAVPTGQLPEAPTGADHVQAAALPVAGLTAWQSLVRVAGLRTGQRVLVHAAAGGVGHLAVQVAKALGAYVIGTARQDKHEFLRELGIDEVVDYTRVDFVTAVKDVDVVVDPIVEHGYAPRSLDVLVPGGLLIDVRGTGPDRGAVDSVAEARGLRYVRFGFEPSGADLAELARLVADGAVRARIAHALPLEAAARAHELIESGHVAGKIVLTL